MTSEASPVLTRRVLGRAGVAAVAIGAAAAVLPAGEAEASSYSHSYYTYGPARLIDSRDGTGGYTGPILKGQTRIFDLGHLFVPAIGDLVCNITVVNTDASSNGFLTFWGQGTRPNTSDINWFGRNQVLANTIHVTTANVGSKAIFSYFCGGANARTDVIVDIKGYFYSPTTVALASRPKGPGER